MIDAIKQQLDTDMTYDQKLNTAREYLQIICLKIMSDHKMFDNIAFLGGTSLRILFDLRRFSEDLDFSSTNGFNMDVNLIRDQFIKGLQQYGLEVETKTKSVGAVQSINLKFLNIMKEVGLSNLSSQKLVIKWDIDTNPPKGATVTDSIIQKKYMFAVKHYDLPSLFARKLHACYFRTYIKGRDWYDFVWYLGQKFYPNFELLNNAIEQTQGSNYNLDEKNFKDFLMDGLKKIDIEKAGGDIERFLEDPNEASIFKQEIFINLINQTFPI